MRSVDHNVCAMRKCILYIVSIGGLARGAKLVWTETLCLRRFAVWFRLGFTMFSDDNEWICLTCGGLDVSIQHHPPPSNDSARNNSRKLYIESRTIYIYTWVCMCVFVKFAFQQITQFPVDEYTFYNDRRQSIFANIYTLQSLYLFDIRNRMCCWVYLNGEF